MSSVAAPSAFDFSFIRTLGELVRHVVAGLHPGPSVSQADVDASFAELKRVVENATVSYISVAERIRNLPKYPEDDSFLPPDVRETIVLNRVELRELEATLSDSLLPEGDDPFSVLMRSFARPYNDALRSLLRAISDQHAYWDHLIADDDAEEAESAAWVESNPAVLTEPATISWRDKKRAREAGTA